MAISTELNSRFFQYANPPAATQTNLSNELIFLHHYNDSVVFSCVFSPVEERGEEDARLCSPADPPPPSLSIGFCPFRKRGFLPPFRGFVLFGWRSFRLVSSSLVARITASFVILSVSSSARIFPLQRSNRLNLSLLFFGEVFVVSTDFSPSLSSS